MKLLACTRACRRQFKSRNAQRNFMKNISKLIDLLCLFMNFSGELDNAKNLNGPILKFGRMTVLTKIRKMAETDHLTLFPFLKGDKTSDIFQIESSNLIEHYQI